MIRPDGFIRPAKPTIPASIQRRQATQPAEQGHKISFFSARAFLVGARFFALVSLP
jgi:hypothetical protein